MMNMDPWVVLAFYTLAHFPTPSLKLVLQTHSY
jgi:hypothetical protein